MKRSLTRRGLLRGSAAVVSYLAVRPLAFAKPDTAPLKAGIAEISITPSWSTNLWGYGGLRYTPGVRDELFAKAFLFDGHKRFLMIMMDCGAIGFPLTRRIARHISETIKIDPEAIMIQVTHDHSAPAVLAWPATPADERYQRFLEDKLVALALAAEHDLAPAQLAYGRVESSIALNRRVGNRQSTWNKDSGPIDNVFSVLQVKSPQGGNRGIIVNYPSHPVTLRPDNDRISADFPGVLYRELGRSTGCPVAYMQGCCGDMIPKVFGTAAEMEDYGRKMADEARRALAVVAPVSGDSLEFRAKRVILTFVAPYSLQEFRTRYSEFTNNRGTEAWAERFLRYLEDGGDIRQSRDTVVQALRLGDLAVAILPGEILHLTAQLIRQEFPAQKLMIAAYANDLSMGYLPHQDEYPKGGYEVEQAWKIYSTLRTTPDMERSVRQASIELLQGLLEEHPR